MQKTDLKRVRLWLEEYADARIESCSKEDGLPLAFKRAHTMRVADDASQIAAELGWGNSDVYLAEAIAILHDTARFEQYICYKTFVDAETFDHGEKAAEIVQNHSVLDELPQEERSIAVTAIRLHNKRRIPDEIQGRALQQLKLIRDADKIDILHSVPLILREGWHTAHPGILLDVDFDGPLTQSLVTEVLETNSGGYENVNSMADIHLMRVAWVYSINYKPSLKRIVERNLYEEAVSHLPNTPEVKEICARAFRHVQDALAS